MTRTLLLGVLISTLAGACKDARDATPSAVAQIWRPGSFARPTPSASPTTPCAGCA